MKLSLLQIFTVFACDLGGPKECSHGSAEKTTAFISMQAELLSCFCFLSDLGVEILLFSSD